MLKGGMVGAIPPFSQPDFPHIRPFLFIGSREKGMSVLNYHRKRVFRILAVLVSLTLMFGGYWFMRQMGTAPAITSCRFPEQIFVVDAGHGGEDGGAVSFSGQTESEMNLAVSRRLDLLLGFYGVDVIMTRTEDISLHDPSADTIRQKKTSDLKNRVKLINALEDPTLISIHQNSFPQKSSHGLQVFYGQEERSKILADRIQRIVAEHLDAGNHRQAMKIPDTVYLMKNISCRAILVECGFLSNPTEDRLLQESAYQTKIAMSIAAGCLNEREFQGA